MTWSALREELDRWAAAGEKATLWWRDDAVSDWSPALYRLLQVAEAGPVPLALAVAPMTAGPRLAERLAKASRVRVLQHGYALRNHACEPALPCEYPPERTASAVVGEVCHGWLRLSELFARRTLPVFVPPWNRMADNLLTAVSGLGFKGISRFGPRESVCGDGGLLIVNAHVDLLDWTAAPRFAGESRVLGAVIAHLAARRMGHADRNEPTGLLTHHLELDGPAWAFLEALVAATASHPAVRWLAPEVVFSRTERIGSYLRPLSPRVG